MLKPSRSAFLPVRGIEYHVREWGDPAAPKVVLLHGAQDVSASWQFTVDAMKQDWHFIAPDWRGYGMSGWSGAQNYWIPDYVADLHMILAHYSPDEPALMFTHSLGGNVTSVYAGLRPGRVKKFINVEGYNIPSIKVEDSWKRYDSWLKEIEKPVSERTYESYEVFARRLRKGNPRMTEERALFLAQHWCKEVPGGVGLRSDPAYNRGSPLSYRLEENMDLWRKITAPTLWIEGGASEWLHQMLGKPGEYEARKACYRSLQIERFEEAGHNIHHEEPERLAEVCEAFLLKKS